MSWLWSVRQRRRLELLEQRQVECFVRPATAVSDRSRGAGWMRGVGTLRRGLLQFHPVGGVVVPGPDPFTIRVVDMVMLDEAPEPWSIPELIGIDPKQIVLLVGADGRFHLRLQRQDLDRALRELIGEQAAQDRG